MHKRLMHESTSNLSISDLKINALISQSWASGGEGCRQLDNYCNQFYKMAVYSILNKQYIDSTQ